MITLFTTTKNFNAHNQTIQINALKSWGASCKNVEILLIGQCEGIEAVKDIPNIKYIPSVFSNERGVPYINGLFEIANKVAKYDICGFVNADIILTKRFFESVFHIHTQIQTNYLVVGQRLNIDVLEPIAFAENWEKIFEEAYLSSSKLQPPWGSDHFVFRKGQYSIDNIPPMLVGRPGWDNWMFYNALKRGLKLIDLSPSVLVLHQNHDYAHKSQNTIVKRTEDTTNLKFLSKNYLQPFTLRTCNYSFENNSVVKKNKSLIYFLTSLSLTIEEYPLLNKFVTCLFKLRRTVKEY
jgi:hypothetical protein